MNKCKLEIACFSLRSALTAQQGGADRIELCDGLPAGGITPGTGMFETARKLIGIPLFVMIRPRGGNFIYSDEEFQQMKKEILHFKKINADGFVFGILKNDGSTDVERNKALVDLAGGLPCTIHRAFDQTPDAEKALADSISCGFSTILTSGHQKNAPEGAEELKHLTALAAAKITVMPGGGVRSSNIQALHQTANSTFYHSSAIINNGEAGLEEVKLLKKLLEI